MTHNDLTIFHRQESALFDLLFDTGLRERFANDRHAALAPYELPETAIRDFEIINIDALQLDARMRSDILLTALGKILPLSFAVTSSGNNGLALLRSLLDVKTMRCPPNERTVFFARQLREKLPMLDFENEREIHQINAIVDLELSMAWTAATRKKSAIEAGELSNPQAQLQENWESLPLQLAPYVNAGILPLSYTTLKEAWCPTHSSSLWRELNRNPLSPEKRRQTLQHYQPRLLIARAWLQHASHFDPVVEHYTLELSEGFATLLPHINGNNSVNSILAGLAAAGASNDITNSVKNGFQQLLETGMLHY